MGGDEFTVMLTDIRSKEAITAKVEHIQRIMSEPLGAEFGELTMPSCSIGVACYPMDGEDANTLLSHADSHMYRIERDRSIVV
tara:strand:- start:587 stop:835 length:249 start_codon:yes stop_codon:yes gene_type:complete